MKTAYLVLDMMNDLIHDKGINGTSPMNAQVHERNIIARTAEAIRQARAAGMMIVFVRVAFSDDYREVNPNSPVFGPLKAKGALRLSQWGSQVHEALEQQPADFVIVKHRVSPYFGTPLEAMLRLNGIQRVFCSGVSSHAVVQATVRDSHDRDFEVVVLEDCCAAYSAQEHANSMGSLAPFCKILNSESAFS